MPEETKAERVNNEIPETGPSEETEESPPHTPPGEEGADAAKVTGSETEVDRELVERLERELAEARRQADEHQDKYLRALAELENTRKRLERTYQDRVTRATRDLLRRFLTVADNLERALEVAKGGGDIVAGVELTYRELRRLLSEQGVEPIAAVGQPFDPMIHEAVGVISSDGVEEETVMVELQRGYTHHGELLRPALVEVAKPVEEQAPDSTSEDGE